MSDYCDIWKQSAVIEGTAVVDAVRAYHHFEEALLHEVRWLHFGRDLQFVINVIRLADNSVREQIIEHPMLLALTCVAVQEMHFIGGLTPQMIEDPDQIGWGLSEFAQVVISRDARNSLVPPPASSAGYRVRFEWESVRCITVQCVNLRLEKR